MTLANTPLLDPKEGTKLKPQNIFSPRPKTAFEIKEEEELAFLQEEKLLSKKEKLNIINIEITFGHPDKKEESSEDDDDNLYKVTYYENGERLIENLGLALNNDNKEKKDDNESISNLTKAGFVASPLILQEDFDIKKRIKALNKKLNEFFNKKSEEDMMSKEVEDINEGIKEVRKFKP